MNFNEFFNNSFFEDERDAIKNNIKFKENAKSRSIVIIIITSIFLFFSLLFLLVSILGVVILDEKVESGVFILIGFVFLFFLLMILFLILGIKGLSDPDNFTSNLGVNNIIKLIMTNTNQDANTYRKEQWEYPINIYDFNSIEKCLKSINCWGNSNCVFFCKSAIGRRYTTLNYTVLINQFDNNFCILPLVIKDNIIKAYLDLRIIFNAEDIYKIYKIKSFYGNPKKLFGIHLRKKRWNIFQRWYSNRFKFGLTYNLFNITSYQNENITKFFNYWNIK